MRDVVIFGTGDIARLAHFFFTNDSDVNIIAFTINKEFINEPTYLDLPVVAFEEINKTYPPSEYDMFVALGPQNCNEFRESIYNQAKDTVVECWKGGIVE